MQRILGLLILVFLTACNTVPKKPAPTTEIVEIPVRQFRGIDKELTEPCPIAKGPLSEILDVAKARLEALIYCNDKLLRIRNLQPLIEEKPAD